MAPKVESPWTEPRNLQLETRFSSASTIFEASIEGAVVQLDKNSKMSTKLYFISRTIVELMGNSNLEIPKSKLFNLGRRRDAIVGKYNGRAAAVCSQGSSGIQFGCHHSHKHLPWGGFQAESDRADLSINMRCNYGYGFTFTARCMLAVRNPNSARGIQRE